MAINNKRMIINNSNFALVNWKCFYVEFDDRVGMELRNIQITLESFGSLVIGLNWTKHQKSQTTNENNYIAITST